jgi:hypothetical protein
MVLERGPIQIYPFNIMSHCFYEHDLNPKTCKFVKKCDPGMVRDENFRCINTNTLKKRIKRNKVDEEENLRKRMDDLIASFKRKTNTWEELDNDLRKKVVRIRNQTVKRGFDDLTRNVTNLLKKVDLYTGKTQNLNNPKNLFDNSYTKKNSTVRPRRKTNVSL